MTINITWLPINSFTTVILFMDSALHVKYSDVVQCGAFAVINNYPMDGLATISNLMTLLRNLNYKQTHQIMPIWNGFQKIVFILGEVTFMLRLLIYLLNLFHLRHMIYIMPR